MFIFKNITENKQPETKYGYVAYSPFETNFKATPLIQ